jgi:hypothetical protein
MYELQWIFKNGHDWHMYFRTESEAEAEAARIGLHENPDIVDVRISRVAVNWTGAPLRPRIPGLIPR